MYEEQVKSHLILTNKTFQTTHRFLKKLQKEELGINAITDRRLKRRDVIKNQEIEELKDKIIINSSLKGLHRQITKKIVEAKRLSTMANNFKQKKKKQIIKY